MLALCGRFVFSGGQRERALKAGNSMLVEVENLSKTFGEFRADAGRDEAGERRLQDGAEAGNHRLGGTQIPAHRLADLF